MDVDRVHPAHLTDHRLDVAVVIDVLRATSTAIALLARGVPSVRVVATPADLAALPPSAPDEYLVFSELADARDAGLPCVDNSPALAEELALVGRRPVLVTTNGTRALAAAARCAGTVLVAGFVNLAATTAHLLAAGRRVTLLPAGDFAGADTRTEDERCADALEQLLRGRSPDLDALIADCWNDARVGRRLARHPALRRDFELALTPGRHAVVAGLAAVGPDGALELVRVEGAR